MTEPSIIMQADSVRAILDGRKTQTRRVVKPQPWREPDRALGWAYRGDYREWNDGRADCCPYGVPGETMLWVRETWSPWADAETRENARRSMFQSERDFAPALYRADYDFDDSPLGVGGCERWRPSIHMPKRFARLWLRLTDVRVERADEEGASECGCEVGTWLWVLTFEKATTRASG